MVANVGAVLAAEVPVRISSEPGHSHDVFDVIPLSATVFAALETVGAFAVEPG
jgi:hypothetical protein